MEFWQKYLAPIFKPYVNDYGIIWNTDSDKKS